MATNRNSRRYDYEYDDYEEYDAYYEDEEEEFSLGGPLRRIAGISLVDKLLVLIGIFVIVCGVLTAMTVMKSNSQSKAVEAFSQVGSNLSDIEIIGEQGIRAVGDAQMAKLAEQDVEEPEEAVADQVEEPGE